MLQKNCCFWYQRAGRAKQGALDLHLLRGEGEGSCLRGVRSPGKLSSDPKVKIRSQWREEKSFQTRHPLGAHPWSEGGKTAPGRPTDPQRARTRRRRPGRPRLSEEVCPLIAEPGSPSHQLPGAGSGRRRERQSLPPRQPRRSASSGTVTMGGSASSQLDESKCAYIRGTPAGGFPGARPVRSEPGARLDARAQVPERVTCGVPAALPPSTAGSRAAAAGMTGAHRPSPARGPPAGGQLARAPWSGWGARVQGA